MFLDSAYPPLKTAPRSLEGTFTRRASGAPGIQIRVPAIHPNALPPNITPSSNPGCLASAVSGAHVWAEWLRHACLLGGPQHGDKKWGKWGDNWGTIRKFLRSASGALTYSPVFIPRHRHTHPPSYLAAAFRSSFTTTGQLLLQPSYSSAACLLRYNSLLWPSCIISRS